MGLELSNATSSTCWIFVSLFDEAHNPKVVSSNLTPATNFGSKARTQASGLFVWGRGETQESGCLRLSESRRKRGIRGPKVVSFLRFAQGRQIGLPQPIEEVSGPEPRVPALFYFGEDIQSRMEHPKTYVPKSGTWGTWRGGGWGTEGRLRIGMVCSLLNRQEKC